MSAVAIDWRALALVSTGAVAVLLFVFAVTGWVARRMTRGSIELDAAETAHDSKRGILDVECTLEDLGAVEEERTLTSGGSENPKDAA